MNTTQARITHPGLDDYAKNMMKKNRVPENIAPSEREQMIQRLRIGLRIRRERLLWGLTQEQLSTILCITPNYLGQIERGNRSLSRKMEEKLCRFFHIDHAELYNSPLNELPGEVGEDSFMFPDLNQTEINRLLQSCSPEELALCGQLVRYLLMCLRKTDIADVGEPDMIHAEHRVLH